MILYAEPYRTQPMDERSSPFMAERHRQALEPLSHTCETHCSGTHAFVQYVLSGLLNITAAAPGEASTAAAP